MTKTAYLYDEKTGEFLHSVEVHECPVVAGDYHKPACSTWQELPLVAGGEVAIFAGDKWSIKPDYRGEFWYDADGAKVEVTKIGTPEGLTEVPPPLTAAQLAASVRAERDRLLAVNVDSINPVRYAAMSKAQHVKIGAYRQALLDVTNQKGFPHDVTYPILEG